MTRKTTTYLIQKQSADKSWADYWKFDTAKERDEMWNRPVDKRLIFMYRRVTRTTTIHDTIED